MERLWCRIGVQARLAALHGLLFFSEFFFRIFFHNFFFFFQNFGLAGLRKEGALFIVLSPYLYFNV